MDVCVSLPVSASISQGFESQAIGAIQTPSENAQGNLKEYNTDIKWTSKLLK
jgi:hypothetical protein